MKRFILIAAAVAVVVITGMQFFRPHIEHPPVTGDLQAPANVKAILVRACYDCHSNQTKLRWYDQVQPAYWLVAQHIRNGRKGLNFSNWDKLSPADRKGKLWEAVNQAEQGAMPIKSYALVHPGARLSKKDITGTVHQITPDTGKVNALNKQHYATQVPQPLPKTLNGITYLPDFKNWQVISTSDRFDNGTMRVIYGNAIAIKAVKEHHINPWPNGAVLAKAAWDKIEDEQGNVSTGAFKQVEFMIKNTEQYRSTGGWGFARFKTPKLTPYGKDVMFTNECMNCHKPMAANDLVFTFPIKN
jgi:hypothetical protein